MDFSLNMYASFAQEILKTNLKYPVDYRFPQRQMSLLYSNYFFSNLQRRVNSIVKKQRLPRKLIPNFMVAFELYSRWAVNHELPNNRITHVANGIKAGMSSEGAVWLAVNNVASKEAVDFADMPISWLQEII
jgi:hypothetical protein